MKPISAASLDIIVEKFSEITENDRLAILNRLAKIYPVYYEIVSKLHSWDEESIEIDSIAILFYNVFYIYEVHYNLKLIEFDDTVIKASILLWGEYFKDKKNQGSPHDIITKADKITKQENLSLFFAMNLFNP
jgi:hypothetical protein